MTVQRLEVRPVETMPEELDIGVFYLSPENRIALHSCCCGCGMEVATPLGPGEFSVRIDKRKRVTVRPSIGNHDFPCRSHYFITNGAVEWAGAMTRGKIDEGRKRDRELKRRLRPGKLTTAWAWIRKLARRIY